MPTHNAESVRYHALHIHVYPFLHCQACGAIILPEPKSNRDRHADWHARNDGKVSSVSE